MNLPEISPAVEDIKVRVMSCVSPGGTVKAVSEIVRISLSVDVMAVTLRGASPVLPIVTVTVAASPTLTLPKTIGSGRTVISGDLFSTEPIAPIASISAPPEGEDDIRVSESTNLTNLYVPPGSTYPAMSIPLGWPLTSPKDIQLVPS